MAAPSSMEAYFGLTEADRVDVEENTSVTTYCYDIEDWGFGAAQLQITDTTERIGDEKYPLGVDVLRFIFIDKESEQKCSDFYKLQTNSCKKCYEIPNKDNISYCGYGDWNQYQNSACVAYLSSLGTPFNPEEWQKTKALVDCQYRNFGEFMNVSELKNRYDCVFRGVWYTYVKTDAYMKAKMDESR